MGSFELQKVGLACGWRAYWADGLSGSEGRDGCRPYNQYMIIQIISTWSGYIEGQFTDNDRIDAVRLYVRFLLTDEEHLGMLAFAIKTQDISCHKLVVFTCVS